MTGTTMLISVAKDFSDTPGARAREEGDFSGQQFLEEILLPAYIKAIETRDSITVDLDGTEGYATSFLEAAFGGLSRKYDADEILSVVVLKSDDEPYLVAEIMKYIRDARK
jgi:hypothetical protein